MKETVIAIFDIGKTNKKILLFNNDLKVISETEEKFPVIEDDDGFECDDIELIEKWIKESIIRLVYSYKYDLKAVNFTTYGATLVYLDANGKRLTPVYNYLKPIDEKIPESLYKRYGGRDEFCRRTASPALGMLNSGIQPLWLKAVKPDVFSKIKHILHFPQYLSYTLTGKIYAEHTSIGCHTALWDFDNMSYHPWVKVRGLILPEPVPIGTLNDIVIEGKKLKIGIGIHDSSSSLAPYFAGSKGKFLLLSTGTWCINMNPFNTEKLTAEQLDNDCLCYMSITRQPV
ncbi:MAG: FGGY family carbohydrate kinase, partial [Bacteroidota bacterium]